MKIEKAIEIIENRPVSTHEQFEADVLSVHALQEKQERDKGCKNCTAGDGKFTTKCSKLTMIIIAHIAAES